jgi:riboflavin biosynthesis pyrimidine reductase
VTVESGAESWASFLEAAAVDELAAALAKLNNVAGSSP